MDLISLEHLIAPRLEADIQTYYGQVRFKSSDLSYQEQEKNLQEQSLQVFLDYFKDWNALICVHKDSQFSFWLDQFRKAYISVMLQTNQQSHFFTPNPKHTAERFIGDVLATLKKSFQSTTFLEYLNHCNDQYCKRIDQIREAYLSIGKFSVNAPDQKFYLSYPAGTELLRSIDHVCKAFYSFDKKLNSQSWYQAQVVFSFHHLIRDSYRNAYVIRFYLTFQNTLYSSEINYAALIQQLWQEATHGFGTLLTVVHEDTKGPGGNPFGFGRGDIIEFPEPLNPLENLEMLPESTSSIDEGMNKICVMPKSFKLFHGRQLIR